MNPCTDGKNTPQIEKQTRPLLTAERGQSGNTPAPFKANRYLADPKRPQHLLSECRVNFKMEDPRWPTKNGKCLWEWRQPGIGERTVLGGVEGGPQLQCPTREQGQQKPSRWRPPVRSVAPGHSSLPPRHHLK